MKKINIYTSEEHHLAMSWCFRHNIFIYPIVVKGGFQIEINDNGKIIKSPKIYDNYELQVKGWELYLYFYKKFNK